MSLTNVGDDFCQQCALCHAKFQWLFSLENQALWRENRVSEVQHQNHFMSAYGSPNWTSFVSLYLSHKILSSHLVFLDFLEAVVKAEA